MHKNVMGWWRSASLGSLAALALAVPGFAQSATAGGGQPNYDVREDRSPDKGIASPAFERMPAVEQKAVYSRLYESMSRQETELRASLPSLAVEYSPILQAAEVLGTLSADQFLTAPSTASRESILRDFLTQNGGLYGLTATQVGELVKTQDYTNPAGNLSFVSLQQRVKGLEVFRCELGAAFTNKGELARIRGEIAAEVDYAAAPTVARVNAAEAVAAGAASIDIALSARDLQQTSAAADGRSVVFARGPFGEDIEARQLYFPLRPGTLTLAWSFTLWEQDRAYWILIDAESGGLLWRKNIVNDQTTSYAYTVYNDDSPGPLSPSTATPGSAIQGAAIARTTLTGVGNGDIPGSSTFNTLGWILDTPVGDPDDCTAGNNTIAGVDLGAPNGVDACTPQSAAGVFNYAYNPVPNAAPEAPTLPAYRNGAVTNLFYWTNLYHDRLYDVGFTEPARNFQRDNLGRGGAANDRVSAEAQDSSGTNNANFATGPDGGTGRMQMFIFTGPTPDIDGDLDQEIVIHELTHGLSNRLIGNAAGLGNNRGGSMGEGWGDFYARLLLSSAGENLAGNYASGAYATLNLGSLGTNNYYYGIRRFPYALISSLGGAGATCPTCPHNPLTFADIDPAQNNVTDGAYAENPLNFNGNGATEVHNAGEVWALALLEVRARIIGTLGFAAGNQRMLQLTTDAMKLMPVSPNFIQGRDAIIAADQAGFAGADMADICAGFAARGMGVGAQDNAPAVVQSFTGGGNLTLGTVTFVDTPGSPGNNPNGNGFADPAENLVLNVPLSNGASACSAGNATGVTATPSGGGTGVYGTINVGQTVSQPIAYTVAPGATCGSVLNIPVAINSSLGPTAGSFNLPIGQPVVGLSQNFDAVVPPALPGGWVAVNIPVSAPLWVTNATAPDSAPNRAFVDDPAVVSDKRLDTPSIAVSSAAAQLTFRHTHVLESTFDGGVLEISIGGGPFADILAAGGSFVAGGYNATISSSFSSPIAGRQAWSGTSPGSPGYFTTTVNLPASANGQNVVLRFRMASDISVAGTGWAIDTLTLVNSYTCATVPVELQSFSVE